MESGAKRREQHTKVVTVGRGSENSLGASSTAAYFALRADRDDVKSRCKPLMLEHQRIAFLAEEAKDLCAMVADIERLKAPAKDTPTKGRCKKRSTVAEKLDNAFEAELKEA